MKKRIIFSVILILSIFMITGCNNNEHNYKLRITELVDRCAVLY